jgi:predicted transcriptional regulator
MPIRRSRIELYLTLLSSIKNGVDKPTRIMYAANMSWKPTQDLLDDLVEWELIRERVIKKGSRFHKRYTIKEKGIRVINYFKQGEKMLQVSKTFF